jgi:FkbM family methyltransferase
MHADFSCPEPPAEHDAYFPSLFRPLSDECFVDCGAYDGDTVRVFLEWTGGLFSKIVAFEPDPKNAAALESFAQGNPELSHRIEIRRSAAAERAGLVRFAASGGTDAAISDSGDIEVSCIPLDDALASQRTTFIKMDIEGAEMSALRGGCRVIRRDRPILAVCVYHQQDHLWEVPLTIASELEQTRFAMFGYFKEGMETVCYAVPRERYVG